MLLGGSLITVELSSRETCFLDIPDESPAIPSGFCHLSPVLRAAVWDDMMYRGTHASAVSQSHLVTVLAAFGDDSIDIRRDHSSSLLGQQEFSLGPVECQQRISL